MQRRDEHRSLATTTELKDCSGPPGGARPLSQDLAPERVARARPQEGATSSALRSSEGERAVPAAPAVPPLRVARRGAAAAFEREYVKMVLEHSGGNITRAAALAEVSRQMIQKLMRKYGI